MEIACYKTKLNCYQDKSECKTKWNHIDETVLDNSAEKLKERKIKQNDTKFDI